VPAVLASLKAQNKALHVTTEKLVNTNTELMDRLNKQTEQLKALRDASSKAQSAQAPGKEGPRQQTPGTLTGAAAGYLSLHVSLSLCSLARGVSHTPACSRRTYVNPKFEPVKPPWLHGQCLRMMQIYLLPGLLRSVMIGSCAHTATKFPDAE